MNGMYCGSNVNCDTSFFDGFWDRGGWLILVAFAPAFIVMFFEEGPGWLLLKWLGRIVLVLGTLLLAVVAWHFMAAIPVSTAVLLGAVIIAAGVRSSAGRLNRLTGRSQEQHQERLPRDYPY
jgi:hypothetical protein